MTALVAIFLAPFSVLTAFFALEVLAGLRASRAGSIIASKASAVIVVPAHDEAAVIGETLRSLRDALGTNMRVVVVADNCTDSTAELALAADSEVLERNDLRRRGKGFALAFAADHLRADPPDVVVIMDADCAIDGPSLRALVDSAHVSGAPTQSIYLLRPDRSAAPLVQVSTFAFMLKNLVRQRGLQRLAGRVHLTGSGMAMPFPLFQVSGHTRSSIVEDLALGIELANAGHPPKLVGNAFVWSGSSTEQGTLVQRRRWEGGFLATALREGPKEALNGLARGRPGAVFAGLDLLIPPLALFTVLNVAVLIGATAILVAFGGEWWPVIAHVILLAMAMAAVFAAWAREGREFISLGVLTRLPLYVLWKLPMYMGLARRGTPKEWLRTER